MSKLLDLLAQQKQLEEQIKSLQSNEQEAKVMKFVEELEALRNKYTYTVPDFIDVVHSLHQIKTPAKTARSVSEKAPKEIKPQFKVTINGVDVVLKESTRGIMKEDLESVVKKAGFKKYADYLADLMKKNDVDSFDALIKKLGGVPVTA